MPVGGDALAGGLFLGRTDFDNEVSARLQMFDGPIDETVKNHEPARTAVESQMRLIVANPSRQIGYILMSDIRGVAQHEVEVLLSRR
jgi:hypothetical protein